MKVTLELDMKPFLAGLSEAAKKRVPAALADGLNHTVSGARVALQKEMDDVFRPKPTPYIRNSVRTQTADAGDLSAFVYISDREPGKGGLSPLQILLPHVYGGPRALKASERALRGMGFMGAGQHIVPGVGAPKDAYGNISGGQMKRILGFIGAQRGTGYNKTKKTGDHYVIPFVGVFKHVGSGASVPVLHFTYAAPQYEKGTFDFHHVIAEHVKKNLLKNIVQAWGKSSFKAGYYGK